MDADGARKGTQFQVNTYLTDHQNFPAVAMTPDGRFVVAWNSPDPATNSVNTIQGQRYSPAGDPEGEQFQINNRNDIYQGLPDVEMDPDGKFVVVWDSLGFSLGNDDSGFSVQAQRLDSSGAKVGSQFQVNTEHARSQKQPAIAMTEVGDFAVVWLSEVFDGVIDRGDIRGQRFSADGAMVVGEFEVNTNTSGYQRAPSVALGSAGSLVAVWESETSLGTDSDGYSVQGRCYDGFGAPLDEEFQINTWTTGDQSRPRVAFGSGGDFVVIWYGPATADEDADLAVRAQAFDAGCSPLGAEFQVNSTTLNHFGAHVAAGPNDTFVVIWEHIPAQGSKEVLGQKFVFGQAAVFLDGFESGDTSAWSSTQ
jgi:hypothetical protein